VLFHAPVRENPVAGPRDCHGLHARNIVLSGARTVMIEDLEAIGPVSEIGGFRRRVFYTSGQP